MQRTGSPHTHMQHVQKFEINVGLAKYNWCLSDSYWISWGNRANYHGKKAIDRKTTILQQMLTCSIPARILYSSTYGRTPSDLAGSKRTGSSAVKPSPSKPSLQVTMESPPKGTILHTALASPQGLSSQVCPAILHTAERVYHRSRNKRPGFRRGHIFASGSGLVPLDIEHHRSVVCLLLAFLEKAYG